MSNWFLQKRLTDPAFGASKPTGDAVFYAVRNNASKGPCWTGYHRDYSKKEYTDNSCVKNGSSKSISKKKRKSKTGKRKKRPSKTKKDKDSSTDGSSTDSGSESKKKE